MRGVLKLNCWTTAWGLTLLSLGISYNFPAQAQQETLTDRAEQGDATQDRHHQYHHYRLIDVGTFGGPFSVVNGGENFINNAGTIVGGADTSVPTPVPGCYNPVNLRDCYISHAFVWSHHHLKDLGTLPGGYFSFAEGINNAGQIVGVSENGQIDPAYGNPQFHAVLWENGIIEDLGTLGGMSSFATTINDRGEVMGVAQNDVPDPFSILGGTGDGTSLTQTRGFLWENGKMHDLGTLGGPDTFAIFLNQRGQVAGMSYTSDTPGQSGVPAMDPFLWENGKIKDLGNFGGTNPLNPYSGWIAGLNNRGQVTGTLSLPGDQTAHPFLWDGEKLTDLGTLGGSYGLSSGLNEAGAVVGMAYLPGDNVFHAFLWKNRVMTDLGTVDSDACSVATNVNSIGQVVGVSQASDGKGGCVNPFTHAFLWEHGGPSVDLNSLIVPKSLAVETRRVVRITMPVTILMCLSPATKIIPTSTAATTGWWKRHQPSVNGADSPCRAARAAIWV
jgi:probable HAF family extracellular repeat protein